MWSILPQFWILHSSGTEQTKRIERIVDWFLFHWFFMVETVVSGENIYVYEYIYIWIYSSYGKLIKSNVVMLFHKIDDDDDGCRTLKTKHNYWSRKKNKRNKCRRNNNNNKKPINNVAVSDTNTFCRQKVSTKLSVRLKDELTSIN